MPRKRLKRSSRRLQQQQQAWEAHRRSAVASLYEGGLFQLLAKGHYRGRGAGEAFVVALTAAWLGGRPSLEYHGHKYHVHLADRREREKVLKAVEEMGIPRLREILYQAHKAFLNWYSRERWSGKTLAQYFQEQAGG